MIDFQPADGFTPQPADNILEEISFNSDGLVPAIAQDVKNGDVLMMAWMNAQAVTETLQSGWVTYWSRSRKSYWRKGETSGHVQKLVDFQIDCDGDTVLMKVEQIGAACHLGTRSCFMRTATNGELVSSES